MPAVTSPDISSLEYDILYDISGAVPAITLTNQSTVIHANLLTWWYVITTPSNTPIHTGTESSPDVFHSAWTTINVPSGSWPMPMGSGACKQIEFSCAAPYVATLYVKDSVDNIFSLTKQVNICRPTGNTVNSCGNFGVASVSIKTDCANARLICLDSTNYSYQNQINPASQNNNWTLVYPQSPSGSQPSNGTATNTASVFFPISYSGDGFNLYVRDYATYDMGSGVSLKMQYKVQKTFNVYCNIDLCQLQCEMDRFFKESFTGCGDLVDATVNQRMTQINFLYGQILTGILQPACDIDVPAQIAKMEELFGFKSQCCCGNGVNMSGSQGLPSGGCCPVSVQVIDKLTGVQPVNCPNGYFPVQVFDPTGDILIGVASDIDNLVAVLNGNAAWRTIGVAINEGNCNVGFILANQGTTVPNVKVALPSTGCVGNTQNYTVQLNDICYPTGTVTISDFPLNAYVDFGLGFGPEYVGYVTSVGDLVIALNSSASKPVSITFSDGGGSYAVIINIFNSDCTGYPGIITITCDAASSSFLLMGASHDSMAVSGAPIHGAIEGFGLRTNSFVGHVPGIDTTKIQWHVTKVGNWMLTTETDTGKIYVHDITNPLMPVFVRTIQLNNVTGSCFSGPLAPYVGGVSRPSFYSLYFPTDFHSMSATEVYVFESASGSAWKLNPAASGSGIVASFYSADLIGVCPRVMVNNKIFFTNDGTLATDLGATPPTTGRIRVIDLTVTFNSSCVSDKVVFGGGADDVWAATYDGVDSIFFMSQRGSISDYRVSTDTVIAVGLNSLGSGALYHRGNIKYYLNKIFASSLGKLNTGRPGATVIDMAGYPSVITHTDFATPASGSPCIYNSHNIIPLGNCLVIQTGESEPSSSVAPQASIIAVYKTDGTFVMECNLPNWENVYNYLPIAGVPVYTPTTLIP